MSQSEIVYLENYRGRRDARFRRVVALHAGDRDHLNLLDQLRAALTLAEADRGGVVWLDEYGPGLAHPFAVLDLGSDQPRRSFSAPLLRAAWNQTVPGLLDLPRIEGRWEGLDDAIASSCVVALGSDGPRSWFLILDSLTPRSALSQDVTGKVMFLAGELASVILHQDLSSVSRTRVVMEGHDGASSGPTSRSSGQTSHSSGQTPSFAGWAILKDMEDREEDDTVSHRIRDRFLVARFIRALVEDHLVMDSDSVSHQVSGIRRELASSARGHPEEEIWARILSAVERHRLVELAGALLELGREVDNQGHLSGALEIFDLAYELARATGSTGAAADAARFQGKVLRTLAEWDRAVGWYEVARAVSLESGDRRTLATVLDGLANAYRDLGKLPVAQETLEQVLEIGEALGDSYILAIGHHDLMTVRKLRGDLVGAIGHGWSAVQSYDSKNGQLRALFDLASTLREGGELSAACDAYAVVAAQIESLEGRILALDALAYAMALKGDEIHHQKVRDLLEAEGWRDVAPVYRGQILYYRGLSYRALGREEEAREWLGEALAFAESHNLNQLIFEAETALEEGPHPAGEDVGRSPYRDPVPDTILGVRQGLQQMKEATAGLAGML